MGFIDDHRNGQIYMDTELALWRLHKKIKEAHAKVYNRSRELETRPKDYYFNPNYKPSSYGGYLHKTFDGRVLHWRCMEATHLMNTARLHERQGRHNVAKAMWRYCAWREKAHA